MKIYYNHDKFDVFQWRDVGHRHDVADDVAAYAPPALGAATP
jgi:hypothetical protein